MFSVYANAFKVKDIRRKLFYVLLVLLVFRIGSHIPLPGLDMGLLYAAGLGETQTIINMIVGGDIGTIFAMGIGPYITASIIMQLLTVAVPQLEQLKKKTAKRAARKSISIRVFWLLLWQCYRVRVQCFPCVLCLHIKTSLFTS